MLISNRIVIGKQFGGDSVSLLRTAHTNYSLLKFEFPPLLAKFALNFLEKRII